MSASNYGVNGTCTRAQVMTFLWRLAGSPIVDDEGGMFDDVPENAYYYHAVLWAQKYGITAGTSKNTFSPNKTCTRAQVMTFLWRCLSE